LCLCFNELHYSQRAFNRIGKYVAVDTDQGLGGIGTILKVTRTIKSKSLEVGKIKVIRYLDTMFNKKLTSGEMILFLAGLENSLAKIQLSMELFSVGVEKRNKSIWCVDELVIRVY